MSKVLDNTLSALLACATIAIVGVEVHREFFSQPAGAAAPTSKHVSDWRLMLPSAHIIGRTSAPVSIIEFVDFQCPYCRDFNRALAVAQAKYPNAISAGLIHLPLIGHKYARDAARASECAGFAGRFAEAVNVLFDKQDSLGTLRWTDLARRAGVTDTAQFGRCMADSLATPRVASGVALGVRERINGTPTVILNGWRYAAAPGDTELVRAIGDILAGRTPYKGFPVEEVVRRK